MKLLIKPDNNITYNLYENSEHFHEGDSGIDLYCPHTFIVAPKNNI